MLLLDNIYTRMQINYLDFFGDLLCESMSMLDLQKSALKYMKGTGGHGRAKRAGTVRVKSTPQAMTDGRETWNFSYKSNPSTTGKRWQGQIQFLKGELKSNHKGDFKDNAVELQCMVNCTCPDYMYVWAYPNKKHGAGFTGSPYNDNNGRPWLQSSKPNQLTPTDRRKNPDQIPGLCKHLFALNNHLITVIKPDANIMQRGQDLYERIVQYGKSNPDFEVPYYDYDQLNENGIIKGSLIAPPDVHEYMITISGGVLKYAFSPTTKEYEILNIGVDPDCREQGKATELLDSFFEMVKKYGGYVTTGALSSSGEAFLRKLHDRFGKKYGVRIVDISRYD